MTNCSGLPICTFFFSFLNMHAVGRGQLATVLRPKDGKTNVMNGWFPIQCACFTVLFTSLALTKNISLFQGIHETEQNMTGTPRNSNVSRCNCPKPVCSLRRGILRLRRRNNASGSSFDGRLFWSVLATPRSRIRTMIRSLGLFGLGKADLQARLKSIDASGAWVWMID